MHCYVHVNTLKFFVNQTAIIETALEMKSSMLLFYNSRGNVVLFQIKRGKKYIKLEFGVIFTCKDALLNTLLN